VLTQTERELSISDIAYDVNKKLGYTVYIAENEQYVPYLVLTSNYNGSALLLRENILSDAFCIRDVNWEGSGGSYYPGSDVDSYLSGEYLLRFTQFVKETMAETEIIVTTKRSLQKGGGFEETEKIKRKAFILSAAELGIKSGMANTEGNLLKFFKNAKSLAAVNEKGETQVYWTRTPYLVDDIKTWTVSYDGSWGSCPTALKQMIRPAFCVNRDTIVSKRNDIISKKAVYVLDPVHMNE